MAFLVSILLLSVSMEGQNLYVGSYNVRNQNDTDKNAGNGWTERCKTICSFLNFQLPDVVGTQEVKVNQLNDMLSQLNGYDYVGIGRDDGKTAGEYSAIFFRKATIEKLQEGHFWLSENTTEPNVGWDALYPRICSWGKFRHKVSGQVFFFFNLHMDHIGTTARRESAKLVVSKIKEYAANGEPVVLTGDFNVDQKNEIYTIFTNSGLLRDGFMSARQRFSENGTCTGFDVNSVTDSRIDHVFVTDNLEVAHYGVLTPCYWSGSNGSYTCRMNSDHFPVMAKLKLRQDNVRRVAPAIVMSSSYAMPGQPVTLTAKGGDTEGALYRWMLPDNADVLGGGLHEASITLSFPSQGNHSVQLQESYNGVSAVAKCVIDVYDEAGYKQIGNVALHKGIDCYSGSTNYKEMPGNMLDGVTSPEVIYEKWCSIGSDHWSVIDLRDSYRIYGFRIHDCKAGPEKGSPNFGNYRIALSDDGLHWREVVNETHREGDDVKTDFISPVTARFVRVNPWGEGEFTMRIWEFEVLGYDFKSHLTVEPLSLFGWNSDVVAEALPSAAHVSKTLDGKGWVLFSNSVQRDGAMPDNGKLFSASGAYYQLEDYSRNNAVVMAEADKPVTLTLASPARMQRFYLLTMSANGSSKVDVAVNYSDGSTEVKQFDVADWYSATPSGEEAFYGLGRLITTTKDKWTADDRDNRRNFRLFELAVDANEEKAAVSVTLTSRNGNAMPTVLALSASTIPQESPTTLVGPSLSYGTGRQANLLNRHLYRQGDLLTVALQDAGELAVYACNGKKVYGGMAGNSGTTQVNTDGWLSGLYIVRVKTEKGERNEKFIIK